MQQEHALRDTITGMVVQTACKEQALTQWSEWTPMPIEAYGIWTAVHQ